MGISYINGWELGAGLSVYTVNAAGAAPGGHDRAWVAYTTTQDPGAQNDGQLGNINTNDTDAGEVDGSIPVGGGKCALALTAPNDSHIEFLSPPNLLDGEQGAGSTFHGTNGKGLKRMGFRFFYRAPEAFEIGTDQLCRFYDGDLGRSFSDGGGNKTEDGVPLFRLSFKADPGNDPGKAGLIVKTYNNVVLGSTTQSCFSVSTGEASSWHQIAITVVVGPAPGENPQDSDGLILINVDGQDVVTVVDTAIEFPAFLSPANAIEYYSLLTSNTNANSNAPIRTLFDNIAVYDHWQPDQFGGDFSNLQNTIGSTNTLNQCVQGLFPVNLTEAGNDDSNDWGNWTASDGGAPSGTAHLAVQGDDGFTSGSPPENPIPYAGGSYLKTNDAGPNSKYSVDTWDRGMVDAAWDSNIDEIRAIRIINVCKLKNEGEETALLTFEAPPSNGAPASGGTSANKELIGTDFQIISTVFDYNPDGNGDGSPGPLIPGGNPADKSYILDSMRIGLKIDA